MRYQRVAPVVTALCPILLFVEYHDDGIFPLLRHLAPPPNTNDDTEHCPAQGGITAEGDLEQLNGDSVRSDSLSPMSGWRLSAPASWAKLLAACSPATVQIKPRRLGVDEGVEPPDPSFADELNIPQEYALLVFDVRRPAVSVPFPVHRFWILVEAGLVVFSSACFEFADEVSKEAQHGHLANLPKIFSSHLHDLSKVDVVRFCA